MSNNRPAGTIVPDRRGGFSLVSTVVAVVLLGITATALSTSTVYILAVQTDSDARTIATGIASAHLEEVKARSPESIVSESPQRVGHAGTDNEAGPFLRSLDVAPEEGLAHAKRITVRVEYPSGFGRTRVVEFETVLYAGS